MISRLALDSGPLIALFYKPDFYHTDAVKGIEQLKQVNAQLIAPLPILFEVHKFLLYQGQRTLADASLKVMLRMSRIDEFSVDDLGELTALANTPRSWNGSLEDASVVLTARKFRCPAWTFNYRDFAAFRDLELWNPS